MHAPLNLASVLSTSSQAKIEAIAIKCYRAAGVEYLPEAEAQIEK